MTIQIPQVVRVGAVDYDVEITKGLHMADGLWGAVNYGISKISVEDSLSPPRLVDTYIHELTHAIYYEAGYEDQDEDTVNRIAKVLSMVLRDNDFTFMRETEESE